MVLHAFQACPCLLASLLPCPSCLLASLLPCSLCLLSTVPRRVVVEACQNARSCTSRPKRPDRGLRGQNGDIVHLPGCGWVLRGLALGLVGSGSVWFDLAELGWLAGWLWLLGCGCGCGWLCGWLWATLAGFGCLAVAVAVAGCVAACAWLAVWLAGWMAGWLCLAGAAAGCGSLWR